MIIRTCPEDTASQYNGLPLLQQTSGVSSSVLQELAPIFIRHNAHNEFGACFLHRHHELFRTFVMVHSVEAGRDICLPREIGSCKIRPRIFFFCRAKDEFRPLEFEEASESEMKCVPSEAFLSDIASFLKSKELDTVLGLSVIPSGGQWVEYVLANNYGTIATQQETGSSNGIITAWAFSVVDGIERVTPLMECNFTVSGVHEPEPPEPPNPPAK